MPQNRGWAVNSNTSGSSRDGPRNLCPASSFTSLSTQVSARLFNELKYIYFLETVHDKHSPDGKSPISLVMDFMRGVYVVPPPRSPAVGSFNIVCRGHALLDTSSPNEEAGDNFGLFDGEVGTTYPCEGGVGYGGDKPGSNAGVKRSLNHHDLPPLELPCAEGCSRIMK
jgi:hypothetical protein